MLKRRLVFFIFQAVILGLAIAFLLSVIWPEILVRPPETVEIRRANEPLPRTDNNHGVLTYAAAVAKATPAVVNINTAKLVTIQPHPYFSDPLFRQYFGRPPQQQRQTSLGSGVIFSDKGYILTNHHVIRNANKIQVFLKDGRSARARVIGTDPESDLAVLKIKLTGLPAITLGRSNNLRVGDVVLAIGNPYGFGLTVTQGIVSATGRNKLGINTFENFIQTDAAINPGNSGGALIDARGNLIGINTAIFSRSGSAAGIGFAIPIDLAKNVFKDIIRYGRPVRGWVGIEAVTLNRDIARALNLKEYQGIIVARVIRGSPADRAGLKVRDIVTAIGDKPVTDGITALNIISGQKPGTRITLTIRRDDKVLKLKMESAERPRQRLR